MNVTPQEIGQMIKKIRKSQGLSQRALAKKAGVSNTTIVNLEKNTATTTIETLQKITEALNTSIDEVIKRIEYEKKKGYDIQNLYEPDFTGYLNLSEKKIGEVIKKLRVSKEMSVSELSNKTGINSSLILGIEDGKIPVNMFVLKKLAEGLGLTVDEILRKSEEEAKKMIEHLDTELVSKKDLKVFLDSVDGIMFYNGQPLNKSDVNLIKDIVESILRNRISTQKKDE